MGTCSSLIGRQMLYGGTEVVNQNMRPDLISRTGSNTTIVVRSALHDGEVLRRRSGSSGVVGPGLLE